MILFLAFNLFIFTSVCLYFVVLLLVNRERKSFSTTFFRLWVSFAAVNILLFFVTFTFYRIPEMVTRESDFGQFLSNFPYPFLLRVIHFSSYFLLYSQNLMLLGIVLNRLKCIALPMTETFWERYFWPTFFVLLCIPTYICYPILLDEAKFFYHKRIQGYVLRGIDKTDENYDLVEMTVFQCICAVLNAGMNGLAIFLLFRRSIKNNRRRELNLFLIGFCCFNIQMTVAILTLLLAIYPSSSTVVSVVLIIRPYVLDSFAISMPYFTLLLNKHIRNRFYELPLIRLIWDTAQGIEPLLEKSPATDV